MLILHCAALPSFAASACDGFCCTVILYVRLGKCRESANYLSSFVNK